MVMKRKKKPIVLGLTPLAQAAIQSCLKVYEEMNNNTFTTTSIFRKYKSDILLNSASVISANVNNDIHTTRTLPKLLSLFTPAKVTKVVARKKIENNNFRLSWLLIKIR